MVLKSINDIYFLSRRCTGGVELTDVVDREDKSSATNLGRGHGLRGGKKEWDTMGNLDISKISDHQHVDSW